MKIFLSAVSDQFRACRNALATDLRAVGASVVVQEDFQQHGHSLLEKLEEYIAGCDRIVSLVGNAYGCEPDEAARPVGCLSGRWRCSTSGSSRKMPLSSPPLRRSRFGGPLALSKVHWVRPELVAEITYLGWTDEPLLRHTVFVGLRDDKPAREVRREVASRL